MKRVHISLYPLTMCYSFGVTSYSMYGSVNASPDQPQALIGWFALEWSTVLHALSSPCEGQGWWEGQSEGRYGCSLFSGTV